MTDAIRRTSPATAPRPGAPATAAPPTAAEAAAAREAAPAIAADQGATSGARRPDAVAAVLASQAGASVPDEAELDALFAADAGVEPAGPAEDVLQEGRENPALWRNMDLPGRTIDRDLKDANDAERGGAVLDTLLGRQADAAAAAAALSPEQKAQLRAVAVAIGEDGDHAALLGLQQLVIDGKLTGDPKNAAGQDLLTALHAVATGPLAEGVDRRALLSQLTREIAFPSSTNQGTYPTCGVTSLQMYMAHEDPAELARIVGGLASPEGTVQLRDGQTLARDGGFGPSRDGDKRTISNRLFSDALSELGDPNATYDPATGTFSDGSSALDTGELRRMQTAMTGDRFTGVGPGLKERAPTEQERAAIEAAVARGDVPFQVGLRWTTQGTTHGMHALLVTGIADGKVKLENPWGTEESIPLDAFYERLLIANVPA